MKTLVIDASIAVKWVVQEAGTPEALALRNGARLMAPDLLAAECANILWKKTQRGELAPDEADLAAQLLERADIELMPMRGLMAAATRLAITLSHPAYDCLYLVLALGQNAQFVTADSRLLQKIALHADRTLSAAVVSLAGVSSP
jgi:predicted nucleic acid-binding protein